MADKTKKDLEKENTLLRTKLKEVLDKMVSNDTNSELTENGMGVTKIDNKYKLVKIKYNPISLKAEVTEVVNASHLPEAVHMAEYNAREYLTNFIINQAINRK